MNAPAFHPQVARRVKLYGAGLVYGSTWDDHAHDEDHVRGFIRELVVRHGMGPDIEGFYWAKATSAEAEWFAATAAQGAIDALNDAQLAATLRRLGA